MATRPPHHNPAITLDGNWCAKAGNCGEFSDSRDGRTYKWTKIGTQTWMAENLNFGNRIHEMEKQGDASPNRADKFCYENSDVSCEQYGGLYVWHTAMAFTADCDKKWAGDEGPCLIGQPHRGICPEGWHLADSDDWAELRSFLDENLDDYYRSGVALKAVSGWEAVDWNEDAAGQDYFGWSGLPGGKWLYGNGFGFLGQIGFFWTAAQYDIDYELAHHYLLEYDDEALNRGQDEKGTAAMSVRCVRE